MSTCPKCGTGALITVRTIELGPDDDSDEYTFKTFACNGCPLTGVGYYEESRRGSGEHWHHVGYAVARADFDALNRELARCPDPHNQACGCRAHQRYRAERGSHSPLRLVKLLDGTDRISLG